MENFAATAIIPLVGMAIPILFLLAALVFDLALGLYLLLRFARDRMRPWFGHVERANRGAMATRLHGPTHSMIGAFTLPL